ncbi:hypothetical protein MA16_Dca028666 [Dendrobium catenatum]|uniref:Uncharacterized protein n=1 Tax=Dendrobium catenatum TaxID=906689 RepID=A0A2I0VC76_9ASPA|nr:hypothetical protein MA16_Dca028666 [Dendrobium catenatum]
MKTLKIQLEDPFQRIPDISLRFIAMIAIERAEEVLEGKFQVPLVIKSFTGKSTKLGSTK